MKLTEDHAYLILNILIDKYGAECVEEHFKTKEGAKRLLLRWKGEQDKAKSQYKKELASLNEQLNQPNNKRTMDKKISYQNIEVHHVKREMVGDNWKAIVTVIDDSNPQYPEYPPFEFFGEKASFVERVKAGDRVEISGFLGARWHSPSERSYIGIRGTFCKVTGAANGLPTSTPSFEKGAEPSEEAWKNMNPKQRSAAMNNLYKGFFAKHKDSAKAEKMAREVKARLDAAVNQQVSDEFAEDDLPF